MSMSIPAAWSRPAAGFSRAALRAASPKVACAGRRASPSVVRPAPVKASGAPHQAIPKVSVVVPLFNYERYLEECLDSVLTQSGVALEVLVIDDASQDGSLQVARTLAERDSRVRVEAHVTNRGLVPTINEGLWDVSGTYIVKLDADDMLTPGSLARSVALLEAHPEVGFVYGNPIAFTSWPPPPARQDVSSWSIWSGPDWIAARCVRSGEPSNIFQPEVVIRAEALRSAGRYREDLPHTSDLEMWLRLASLAAVGRVNSCDQGYYRVHGASMQHTVNSGRLVDLRGRLGAFEALFDRMDGIPGGDDLRRTVYRNLARWSLDAVCEAIEVHDESLQPMAELIRFAQQVEPRYRSLPEWRAVQRRMDRSGSTFRVERAMRDVRSRVRWRRWRWTGQ